MQYADVMMAQTFPARHAVGLGLVTVMDEHS